MRLYEALVIDNSTFYKTGKIRVRLPQFYNREMIWNLAEEFPDLIEEAEIEDVDPAVATNDFEAHVYSPYGGGRNFGMFFLPQINQKGVVAPIGKGSSKLLWLGSFFEPERDENFEVTHVNIPSDKPENEGEDSDGVLSGEQNMDAESIEEALKKNFVARFKTTKSDSQENVDWQKRPTSNIITIGESEATVTHFSEEDGWDETTPQKWQNISIKKNKDDEDQISGEIHNEADSKASSISLKENKLTIEIDNDGDISKLFIANDGDEISFSFEDSYGNIITLDKENGITAESEKDITAKTKGNVIVDAEKLQVNDASDTGVLYSQLKKIIDAFEKHIHIAPSGPTASPLNPDQSPISSKTTKPKSDMESKSVETD